MAVTEKQELDTRTGITRTIVSGGYAPSPYLPGATVVPSNAGRFGGQLGVDRNAPFPVVINPGMPSEVRLESSDLMSHEMQDILREVGGDANTAYTLYAQRKERGELMSSKKNDIDIPGVTTPPVKQAAGKKKFPAKPGTRAERAVSAVNAALAAETVDETAEQAAPATMASVPPENWNGIPKSGATAAMAQQQVKVNMILAELGKLMQGTPMWQDPIPVAHAKPEEKPALLAGMPIPKVQVTFKSHDGSRMTAKYHEVIILDSLVILIYNRTFEFGSQMSPAEDEQPYALTVSKAGESPAMRWVTYQGIAFSHGDYDYQVLVIVSPPEQPSEPPEAA